MSETSFTAIPASFNVRAVPPVEMISTPNFSARVVAKSTSPVLSETEMSARRTGWAMAKSPAAMNESPVRGNSRGGRQEKAPWHERVDYSNGSDGAASARARALRIRPDVAMRASFHCTAAPASGHAPRSTI